MAKEERRGDGRVNAPTCPPQNDQSELALALSSSRTRDLSKVSRGFLAVLAVHFSNCLTVTSCVVAGCFILTASFVRVPGSKSSTHVCRRNSFTASAAAS